MPSKVTRFPPRPGTQNMGFANFVAAAASEYARKKAAEKNQQGGGGSAPGGDTAPGMMPQQTTISPTFQQDFTAQVSPAINVQTGGGSITAATQQQVASEQAARGGGTTSAPPGMPGMPPPNVPVSPGSMFPPTSSYQRSIFDRGTPLIQQQPGQTNYTPYIFLGLAGIALLYWMNKNKNKR